MSGGVDSSVAAALLKEAGHEVVGLSMQLYDQSEGQTSFGSCCTLDDLADARRVAALLGFPHYIVNFEREFDATVVSNFVREYLAGRTPLPCARCNSDLKFATLVERARGLDATHVATGHYARVERDLAAGRWLLKRGVDAAKDQSYFLFSLTQDQLSRALFPLGTLRKDQVRDHARRLGLPVAEKHESQEICFVPDGDYAAFIDRRTGEHRGGTIVDAEGKVLGRHEGIHHYTIGQRKGLNVATGRRLYVLALSAETDTVVVGPRTALEQSRLTASAVNWISGEPPSAPIAVTAQIRYRHPAVPARVTALDAGRASLDFETPQAAVTPGQAVVFYDVDVVLGGGWIESGSSQ